MRGLDPRIHLPERLQKTMDCRVKPGDDDAGDNSRDEGLTFADTNVISTPPGTSGLSAFGLEWE
jgi:hypothetical protein